MCTKVLYPTRWHAEKAVEKLREQGWVVRAIHPCYGPHQGSWHITRQSTRYSRSD